MSIRYREEVRAITVKGKRATGVRLASGEEIAADVVVSNADSAWTYRYLLPPASAPSLDRPAHRPRALLDEPLRLVLRHPSPVSGRSRTTRSCSGRATASCSRTSSSARCSRPTSASICTGRPRPIRRWHRPAATRSTCCRRCRTWAADIDWASAGRALPAGDRALPRRDAAPGSRNRRSSPRGCVTPQDFQDRLLSFRGAAFGLEPVLTQSAWFRPHNRSEDIERLYLVGAGTHPGAGVPGVLSSARILDTVVPDAAALV